MVSYLGQLASVKVEDSDSFHIPLIRIIDAFEGHVFLILK